MGRYIKDLELNKPIDIVSMVMDDFTYHNSLVRTDWNGEMVFGTKDRLGKEIFIKWSYAAGMFHIEAWSKGAFGGESGISGSPVKAEIDKLLRRLEIQNANQQVAGGHIGSDPIHHDTHHKTNHQEWKQDTKWQTDSNDNTDAAKQIQYTILKNKANIGVLVAALLVGGPVGALIVYGILKKADKSDNENEKNSARTICITLIVVIFICRVIVGMTGFMDM